MIALYEYLLPSGWQEKQLKEVSILKRGISWSKEQETDVPGEGTTPVIRIPNIQEKLDMTNQLHLRGVSEEAIEQSAVTKGWTLFVASNGNLDRIGDSVYVAENSEMVFASFLQAITSKSPDELLPEYLSLWLKLHSVHQWFSRTAQQTTGLGNFAWSAVKRLPIRFPKDLNEQRIVVKAVNRADEALDATKKEIEAIERLKRSLMQQLFTKGIPGRHQRFKQVKSIGNVPECWDVGELMKHAGGPSSVRTGPFGAQLMPDAFGNEGIRMVNITDIAEGKLDFDTEVYVKPDIARRLEDYLLLEGDLIFSRVASVGRVALIEAEQAPLMMSSNCVRIRPGREFNSRFLVYLFLGAESVRRQVLGLATGGSRAIATPRVLRRLKIAKPQKGEQDEISDMILAVEKAVTSLENELTVNQRLKQSLLQNLLTGRVRVGSGVTA